MKPERLLVRQTSTFYRNVEHRIGHAALEFVDATTELFLRLPCGRGKLLLVIYCGQQSQDVLHAGVKLANNADAKVLAIIPRNNGRIKFICGNAASRLKPP